MSNKSSERICPSHCVHEPQWARQGYCIFPVAIHAANGSTDLCGHKCAFPAEADAQREPELCDGCKLPLNLHGIGDNDCWGCELAALRSRPTVAEIRRQAFDDAIRVCESYENEDYAIDVCDTAKEIAKEIRALAAPIPSKNSGDEATESLEIETKGRITTTD